MDSKTGQSYTFHPPAQLVTKLLREFSPALAALGEEFLPMMRELGPVLGTTREEGRDRVAGCERGWVRVSLEGLGDGTHNSDTRMGRRYTRVATSSPDGDLDVQVACNPTSKQHEVKSALTARPRWLAAFGERCESDVSTLLRSAGHSEQLAKRIRRERGTLINDKQHGVEAVSLLEEFGQFSRALSGKDFFLVKAMGQDDLQTKTNRETRHHPMIH